MCMNSYINTLSSILVLVVLISFIAWLRYIGLLKKEDGILFSKIVTHLTLPAVVFSVLSHSKSLELDYLLIAFYILISEVILLVIAWFIGKKLKLSSAELGTFMIVSAFGSSALLGYVIIGQIFPSNIQALSEAVIVSELGVGIGLFTIGTMVAIYFGGSSEQKQTPLQSMAIFAKSPLFLSIIAGVTYSSFNFPVEGAFFSNFFDAVNIIAKANTFFVALTVGVLLQFSGLRSIISLVFIVILLKLIIAPFLVWVPVSLMELSKMQIEVAILETAMPSAMLSVVLAAKYGCDAQLASKLVFATTIFSLVTITLIMGIS